MEILKETGHWEDTFVMFISDNGIAFPGAKTNLYDPGMQLPCVVRNPYAKKHGLVTDAMINWADIAPTILGLRPGESRRWTFTGVPSWTCWKRRGPKGWDEVYASHTFHEITMYYPMKVVRTRKYKLIWNIAHGLDYPFASDLYASATWQDILKSGASHYAKRPVEDYIHRAKFELYDLEDDPYEVNNLADDEAHAEVLSELQGKLKAFQQRTKDPWIVKWKYE